MCDITKTRQTNPIVRLYWYTLIIENVVVWGTQNNCSEQDDQKVQNNAYLHMLGILYILKAVSFINKETCLCTPK